MTPVVYDAGVPVAANIKVRAVWADHRVRLEAGIPAVPASVIAQVSRSADQVQLRRPLRGCEVIPRASREHTRSASSWAALQPGMSSTLSSPGQPPTCGRTWLPVTAPTSAAASGPRAPPVRSSTSGVPGRHEQQGSLFASSRIICCWRADRPPRYGPVEVQLRG